MTQYISIENAQNKLCCGPEGCGINTHPHNSRYCAGPQCMAWQWKVIKGDSFMDVRGPDTLSKEYGYCGYLK